MNILLRLILFICLIFAGQSYATTAMPHGDEASVVQFGVESLNNDGLINPSGCCSKLSSRDSQDRAQARAFFAFAADFYVPKGMSNLNIRGLDDVPDGLANPASIRSDISQHVKASNRENFSVATASVEVDGQTQHFISVSGNSWKGNAPDTVTINGQSYTVVRTDSGGLPSAQNGTQTNFNHAEQKLFSYIQDNYSGQNAKVNVAVQNTSTGSPGMCAGCSTTSNSFASGNSDFSINIFQGSSGVNP